MYETRTTVADLTQDEYEALTGRERKAVDRLLYDIAEDFTHAASSANDLTPGQLADEYDGADGETFAYGSPERPAEITVDEFAALCYGGQA